MPHLRSRSSGTSAPIDLCPHRAAESSDRDQFANLRVSHENPTGDVGVVRYVAFWKEDL